MDPHDADNRHRGDDRQEKHGPEEALETVGVHFDEVGDQAAEQHLYRNCDRCPDRHVCNRDPEYLVPQDRNIRIQRDPASLVGPKTLAYNPHDGVGDEDQEQQDRRNGKGILRNKRSKRVPFRCRLRFIRNGHRGVPTPAFPNSGPICSAFGPLTVSLFYWAAATCSSAAFGSSDPAATPASASCSAWLTLGSASR